ncbi:hypothetical protein C8R43DRAFT_15570 [Mycena crocata]|nr:hypothetical protein C8R43DRAFT_15570 [Mycena crocata]
MNLLDLSPELVCLVFDHLAPDSKALDNLCLAGNHNLLHLVRPYTWREINTTIGHGRHDKHRSSKTLASRFETFFSDPARAFAVRSLNVIILGFFDWNTPASLALSQKFTKLVNVTHGSVSCVNAAMGDGMGPGVFVQSMIRRIPHLMSLKVDGVLRLIDADDFLVNMDDDPIPPLVHLAVRFCDPEIGSLWSHCLKLKIVEMQGGDGRKFWEENRLKDDQYKGIKPEFEGRLEYDHGLFFLWMEANESSPPILNTIERIKIKSTNPLSADLFDDNPDLVPASLKDLCIDIPIDVVGFCSALRGIRGPVIERLAIKFLHEDVNPDQLDDLLKDVVNGKYSTGPFFAPCKSLRDLCFPVDGLCLVSQPFIISLLSAAPALEHLTFATPVQQDIHTSLETAAAIYSHSLSSLCSVSWQNVCTFQIASESREISRRPYSVPEWHQWTGIGPWWEMDRPVASMQHDRLQS